MEATGACGGEDMLYFVGVGPGDPELITLKAARVLQAADAIAVADSGKNSVVLSIAAQWTANKPVCPLSIPMQGERTDWESAHTRAVEELLKWLERYENVAYPVLGDPGIYASSSYLLRKIAPLHPCRVIPGVAAMCAVAAELQIPLCEQQEALQVLDHLPEHAQIPQGNVVLMKAGRSMDALRRLAGSREVYLGCNVGREGQWLDRLENVRQDVPYFTTAILK